VSEDACAGLTASLALFGRRSLWCSFEAFAINGLPVWHTVTQALSELRRSAPSAVVVLSALAVEHARNGWTHQRPEVQAYVAAMMRNGNVFALFPPDANSAQKCYEWASQANNKGIVIFAGRSPAQVRTRFEDTARALRDGAFIARELPGAGTVVLAAVGDRMLDSALEASALLNDRGVGVRVVCIVNPRRLFRERDVAWAACREPDGSFLADRQFDELFHGDALLGITGGSSAILEPLLLRSRTRRDVLAWKRGETGSGPQQLIELNGLSGAAIAKRALELCS
jgi:phosphoketolase